jgi:hypothetical protein
MVHARLACLARTSLLQPMHPPRRMLCKQPRGTSNTQLSYAAVAEQKDTPGHAAAAANAQ